MSLRRLLSLLPVLAACNSLPFKEDVGFLISAQANSPEFPVYVNGHLCTDMEGYVGLCSKRVKSSEDIVLKFDPQDYAYLMTVKCSSGIPQVPVSTVPSGQPFSFKITHDQFVQFSAFTCTGEVSPQDRTPPIEAQWEVKFKVYDSQYTAREQIFRIDDGEKHFLVLGQFARTAWVYDEDEWHQHFKDTVVQLRGDPLKAKAYSESFVMRYNFFNMSNRDGGVIR